MKRRLHVRISMVSKKDNSTFCFYFTNQAFLLFRLFDIFKPWPINYLDKHVHGGFGMVLDDVVAGIFSLMCIQILALFF